MGDGPATAHRASAPTGIGRGRHRAHRRRGKRVAAAAGMLIAASVTALAAANVGSARPETSAASHASSSNTDDAQSSAALALDRELQPYKWADQPRGAFRGEGLAVTLVHGLPPVAALAVVAHPDKVGTLGAVRAWAERMSTASLTCVPVGVSRIGAWTVLVEYGGNHTATPAAVSSMSLHRVAVSVSENAELDATVMVARSGRVVRQFDPVLGTSIAGTPLEAEDGIAFGVPTSLSAMSRALLVVARLTGVGLSPVAIAGRSTERAVAYCG